MIQDIRFGNVMVDCADAKKLQDFYAGLLGWDKQDIFGYPAVRGGDIVLMFAQEDDYVPPVWPEEDGKQQKQMHFDFQVPDVLDAVRRAEEIGAAKAKAQFGGTGFVTMLDPAGHPFCLCAEE